MARWFNVSWGQVTEVCLIGSEHIDLFDERAGHFTWVHMLGAIHRQVESLAQALPNKVGTLGRIWAEAIRTNLWAIYLLDLRDFEDVVLGVFSMSEIAQMFGICMILMIASASSTPVESRLLNEDHLSIWTLDVIVSLIYTVSQRTWFLWLWTLMIVFVDPETELSSVTSALEDLFSTLAKTPRFGGLAGHASDRGLLAHLTSTFLVSRHREPTAGPRALHQRVRVLAMLQRGYLLSLIQFTMLPRLGVTTSRLILVFVNSMGIVRPQKWTSDLVLLALNQSIDSSSTVWNSPHVGVFIRNLLLVSVGYLFLRGFASDSAYATHNICTGHNFCILRHHAYRTFLQVCIPDADITTRRFGAASHLAIHGSSLSTLGMHTTFLSAIGALPAKRPTLDRALNQIAWDHEVVLWWS